MAKALHDLVSSNAPLNLSQVRIDIVKRWMASSAYRKTTR